MWKIIWGEMLYRIAAPDGEESQAVHYCTPVSLEYQGRVYAAYLNGDEEESDMVVTIPCGS